MNDGPASSASASAAAGAELSACEHCCKPNPSDFAHVVWETMQFCDENCLGLHQQQYRHCVTCAKNVVPASMGKYCVRFGSNIKQFCSNLCLEDHKKGLKVCCFCQRDIPGGEGFLAPISGDGRGQFKDFCAQSCLRRYQVVYQGAEEEKEVADCAVCGQRKRMEIELVCRLGAPSSIKPQVGRNRKEIALYYTLQHSVSNTLLQGSFPPLVRLCGSPCASAYKFANGVETAPCTQCGRDFDCVSVAGRRRFSVHYNGQARRFCGEACQNVFVMRNRRIIPCASCKVKKYNFDMVEKWIDERNRSVYFVYCYSAGSKTANFFTVISYACPSQRHLLLPQLSEPPRRPRPVRLLARPGLGWWSPARHRPFRRDAGHSVGVQLGRWRHAAAAPGQAAAAAGATLHAAAGQGRDTEGARAGEGHRGPPAGAEGHEEQGDADEAVHADEGCVLPPASVPQGDPDGQLVGEARAHSRSRPILRTCSSQGNH